jgi:hypothetical protein
MIVYRRKKGVKGRMGESSTVLSIDSGEVSE